MVFSAPGGVWERAVRLVLECRVGFGSRWAVICSVSQEFGVSSEMLRRWVGWAGVDAGQRRGIRSEELAELDRLSWP